MVALVAAVAAGLHRSAMKPELVVRFSVLLPAQFTKRVKHRKLSATTTGRDLPC